MRPSTAERDAAFRELWNAGLPTCKIMATLKISGNALGKARVRLGLPARPSSASWSEEDLAFAKAEWLKGVSASQIARKMVGRTRNAVISAIHRNGWDRSGASAPKAATPRVCRPRLAKPPVPVSGGTQPFGAEAEALAAKRIAAGRAALIRAGKIEVESPNARPFLESRNGLCRWPIGTGLEMLSCCNEVARGSYCEGHAAIGYEAPKKNVPIPTLTNSLTRFDRTDIPRPRPANDAGLWDAAA